MALAFSQFGVNDQVLYAAYLATYYGEGAVYSGSGGVDFYRELSEGVDGGNGVQGSVELFGSLLGRRRDVGCAGVGWTRAAFERSFGNDDGGKEFVGEQFCERCGSGAVTGGCEQSGVAGVAVGGFPASVGGSGACKGAVEVVVEVSAKTLLNRERRKAAKERKVRKKAAQADVPEWRRKFATGDLADTWAARKVRENKLAILKADEQIKRLESGAGKPRLQSKVLTEAEQEAKIRADYDAHMQKTNADIAYWKKRQEAGAVDKAIKLEMEIMDGQISGKYDPFASRRTIGWAKTVKTNSTGGSSAKKTVWSGSGASKFSSKESVISLEKHEKELKQKEKEVAYYKELFLKAKDDANKADQYWLDQGEADCAY